MRTIIAGSREATEGQVFHAMLLIGIEPTVVVCGCAPGADTHGKTWADKKGIEVKLYPADWKRYNLSAGPIRNQEMADNADGLIAVWDGVSSGTKDMIKRALNMRLATWVIRTDINKATYISPYQAIWDLRSNVTAEHIEDL